MWLLGLLFVTLSLGQEVQTVLSGRTQAVVISAPLHVPLRASKAVDPSWLGFAIESSSFTNFSNDFSRNLFHDFVKRTDAPIIIRVGGTSMDHAVFDLSQNTTVEYPNGTSENLQSRNILGAPFFAAFEKFNHTKFIVQIPLAQQNRTNIVKMTRELVRRTGPNLFAIEFGNEPDLYADQGARKNPSYGPREYAAEVKRHMDLVVNGVPALPEGRIFYVFEKSSKITDLKWNIYQAYAGDSLQDRLMNHQFTVDKTNNYFRDSILRLNDSLIDFTINEIGSSIGSRQTGNGPDYELSASLGTAIWTVDWMLYVMSINVTRINMQMGRNFPFAAWRPTHSKDLGDPRVLGGFYGHVLVADFIGKGGNIRVKQLQTGHPNITAYAGYDPSDRLARVAATNQRFFTRDMPGERPVETLRLDLHLPGDVTQATVRKLSGPGSLARDNITWAGLDWTFENMGIPAPVKDDTEVVPVTGGGLEIRIEASQALLVSW